METVGARVAMVSMHTSPVARAGTGDAGGMNVLLLSVATQLAARGVLVDLLTRASTGPSVREIADGITLYELSAGPPGPLPKTGLVGVTDEFGEGVADLAGRRGSGYDVIHAHYWLSGLATLPVSIELGIPFVQSFHTLAAMKNASLAPGQAPEPEMRVRSEMFLAGQSSAVVAGSAAEVATLIDEVRAPADRIWVIPPGVDVTFFRATRAAESEARVRRELEIAPGRPIVVVAGRVQPLKGQELAVRTLGELKASGGPLPVMVIAGEATPDEDAYLSRLKDVAADLGVEADLHFVGGLDRDSLADLLAVASLTLVPSLSETFGLVAIESAASGTPVIGYRGTGLVESVSEGESGVLLDSRDPREWALTVTALLEDRAALQRLSESARHHAEGYTWGATAAALLGVYAGLS